MVSRHWTGFGRWLLVSALLLLPFAGAPVLARPDSDQATLQLAGKVCARDTGKPIAGAQVGIAGRLAVADSAGAYSLSAPAAIHLYAQASAQGYQSTGVVSVSSPSDKLLSGQASLDFCGAAALDTVFASDDGSVKLTPFSQFLPASAGPLNVVGDSTAALEDNAAIATPGGQVVLSPIVHRGTGILLVVPLTGGRGRYVLEINGSAGFAVLKIPIFVGAPYSAPPAPPVFVSDPQSASLAELQNRAGQNINWLRAHAGLSLVQQDARLDQEAQAHSADIVNVGYIAQHAHIGSNGSTPGDRVTAAGVTYHEVAEVVGTGLTVQQILIGLMDSPAHRWAILGHFHLVGVGIVHSGNDLVLTGDFVR